jgi:ferredoxin-NADP reductase
MLEPASLGLISSVAMLGAAGIRVAQEARELARRRQREIDVTEQRSAAFANKLDAAMHWARASRPALKAWTGVRPFRVTAVVDESQDCRSFYLMPEDGRPLSRFEPGQYLTFHLPTADPMRPLVRCYSLSDRPREDYYRVTIRRVTGGKGSSYFHREARPGSRLQIEAPQGGFFLDPTNGSPVVLIGAGIGVTPIVSMASALVHRGDARPVYAFTGFRSSAEHPFRTQMSELAAAAPNMNLDVSYSQPSAEDRHKRLFNHEGHVSLARLQSALPSSNFHYYICGPAAMMESLIPALLGWGIPREHIRYEAFGPASVQGFGDACTAPCRVQFSRSAKSLHWSGKETSLLQVAEQGGVRLESGCRAGSCGQCRVMLAAGKVKHTKPPSIELIDGECLACIARPEGDIIVDA